MKAPLAEILRPHTFEEMVGNSWSTQTIHLTSMILWGPPGCGKTSFARIISEQNPLQKFTLSAVTANTSQFKEIFAMAEQGRKIILLVDEIHHLNKSQQDIFLPHIENGNIILIGTTTENPSFELRPALLSRCKVLIFPRLECDDLEKLLQRTEQFLQISLPLTPEARATLCNMADGDGRYLLNCVEELLEIAPDHPLDDSELGAALHAKIATHDKQSESHYNLISALHKSIRGSDPDAALYWFARMLEGGENPLYIARRLVRCAVEDIGLTDPNALTQAIAAQQAYSFLGSPEGDLAIAQAVVYLATAPKSNSVYIALKKARNFAKSHGNVLPPKHILNAPTALMKQQGYSSGYIYDHDLPEAFSGQNYFPENLTRQKFYTPAERGFEREIQKRLDWWEKLRKTSKISN